MHQSSLLRVAKPNRAYGCSSTGASPLLLQRQATWANLWSSSRAFVGLPMYKSHTSFSSPFIQSNALLLLQSSSVLLYCSSKSSTSTPKANSLNALASGPGLSQPDVLLLCSCNACVQIYVFIRSQFFFRSSHLVNQCLLTQIQCSESAGFGGCAVMNERGFFPWRLTTA